MNKKKGNSQVSEKLNSYQLKLSKIISILSIGIIVGFIVGVTVSFKHILANEYIQYKILRLIGFSLQKFLNKWTTLAIIILIALFILWPVVLFLTKLIWKLFLSNIIEIHIKDKNKMRTIILACLFCSVFFFFGGWIINHYWLPHMFHPISLLGDAGILILTIFLGWIFIKTKCENILKLVKIKYTRRIALILIMFLVIINLWIMVDSKINMPKGPNVIMIISDALRRDHLGCYEYNRDTTPNIDLFARNATLFKNAFAQSPSTKSSIASVFTSKYPSQHNIIYNEDSLNLSYITLSEVLRGNNYITAGFIENPVISKKFKYNQGFKTWKLDDKRHKVTKESMANFDKEIFSWFDKHYKRPFFLYIHYIDPHSPYIAPEPFYNFFDKEYKGKIKGTEATPDYKQWFHKNKRELDHLISLYDDEIRYVDSRFEETIRKLKQLNILDDTIIIFLSDHGEEFLEHGNFRHSNSVYSELINIPFIIRYPNLFKKDIEEKYVQHIDIFPTIMSILNININSLLLEGNNILSSPKKNIKGKSSREKIISEQLAKRQEIIQRSIIFENWKLIHSIYSDNYSLFNIEKDSQDYEDLLEENEEIANSLKSYLSNWLKNLRYRKKSKKVKLDPDIKKKLKSLGYIK